MHQLTEHADCVLPVENQVGKFFGLKKIMGTLKSQAFLSISSYLLSIWKTKQKQTKKNQSVLLQPKIHIYFVVVGNTPGTSREMLPC